MKSLEQIKSLLQKFTDITGMKLYDTKQGSPDWFIIKLGVISSSNAYLAVAQKTSERRATYMASLVAQVATSIFPDVKANAMEWGHDNEDAARAAYEFETDNTVVQIPFVFKDDSYREGSSPDGIVANKNRGVEIKVPYNSENHIKFLIENKIKPEYRWQYQHALRVLEADTWDFCSYDPRMPKHKTKIITVERDNDMQKEMDEKIPEFLHDMDTMLKHLDIPFGAQWIQQ